MKKMTDQEMFDAIKNHTGAYYLFFYAKDPAHESYWKEKVEEGTAGDCEGTWEAEYCLDEINDLEDLRSYNFNDVGDVVAIRGIKKNHFFF